jgi:predicted Zn-dependent protease
LAPAVCLLALILTALTGCAVNPTGGMDFVLMSEEKEIALGRQMHSEILAEFGGAYNDPALQKYVSEVGTKLAAVSDRPELDYTFTLLDDDTVNAFATPGGYVYITRGILTHMNSEAEMAAVLGHEIGHITARHAVQKHSKATIFSAIGAAASYATGSSAASNVTNFFGGALIQGYGRSAELQADGLGAEYIAKAGYPAASMLEVIGILKAREQFEIERARIEGREANVYHGLFSSHPDHDTRLQEVVGAAEKYGDGDPSSVNAEHYYKQIDGMTYGDSRGGAVVRNNEFYHSGLGMKITFPKGWNLTNYPDRVAAVSLNGGAFLQVHAQPIDGAYSPRDFMVRKLGIHDIRDGKEITIAGMPAYLSVASHGNSPYGKRPVRYAIVFDEPRGLAIIFAGAGRDDRHEIGNDGDFIKAIFSFNQMNQSDYQLAQAPRIRVVEVSESTSIEDYASSSPIGLYALQQLRIINHLYPDGEPKPGQMIKIVE